MKIDLHLHSVCSDGTLSPTEVAARTARLGYAYVSLTDHDTDAGTDEMFAACSKSRIGCINGVEISTFEQAEVHILGYNFRRQQSPMAEAFAAFRTVRRERVDTIVKRLTALGYPLDREEIDRLGEGSIGRRHVALAMCQRGYVKTEKEAYERFLKPGRPAWVEHFLMTPTQAVRTIRDSGGVAVLAHPGRIGLSTSCVHALVEKLASAGLGGIESYYMTHTISDVQKYCALAARYGLINTNGSDFHWETSASARVNPYPEAERATVELLLCGR